ncbi:hypothetical protein PMIN01_03780 [Paraphaeosphaeria minitans]|uniref:Uncharacterized protein n=1 Tax=Paraphaeosphaeria minitans TaxID=565426 RepID=A0A9P6GMN2_9PLEO|nr:hypothetical protein PMIN01_03780 [Paraphaeosphaeria minitans]
MTAYPSQVGHRPAKAPRDPVPAGALCFCSRQRGSTLCQLRESRSLLTSTPCLH